MTIHAGDIKLLKSLVMDDVPEGGGGPSNAVVADGVSNELFADISEADRAIGRVSLRKVHVSIQTDDTDTYLGGNVIVAEPPNDPNVSVTLLSTKEVFDTRAQAVARLEAFLSAGANYAAYLFSNHVEGQRTLQLIQRTSILPGIGSALVLTKREGYGDQFVQFVRITDASVIERTFTDTLGDFNRFVLTLTISDALRQDFVGFDAARIDPTKLQMALATKISETIVADAARYYGVVALEEPASIGDLSVKAESIFTQLVPSSQVETAIADARTNQQSSALTPAGSQVIVSVSASLSGGLTPASVYIGGGILPGTLGILINGAIVLTERPGALYLGEIQIGAIDYENGVLIFPTTSWAGVGGFNFVCTYTPAAAPQGVTQSQGFEITIENRSLSYVRTIEPPPLVGSLSMSYCVAGRWYTLRDDGTGALRGADSSYGAGSVNKVTGSVSVTLGALPDIGSATIYQWSETEQAKDANYLQLDNDGNLYWPFNTSGVSSTAAGSKAIEPGSLSITWTVGGTPYTVVDNGSGVLTGHGTGTVDYAKGMFRLSPQPLPPVGTTVNVTTDASSKLTATISIASGAGNFGVTGITPGSVDFVVTGQLKGVYLANPIVDWGPPASYRITDNGAGALQLQIADSKVTVGSINYSAGTFTLNASTVLSTPIALQVTAWDNILIADNNALGMLVEAI